MLKLESSKSSLVKIIVFLNNGIMFFLKQVFASAIYKIKINSGYNLFFDISTVHIYPILFFLHYHSLCRFNILIDMVAYDFPGFKNRFLVIYSVLSKKYNLRLSVRASLSDAHPSIMSLTSLFLNSS
jgi:NADH:ubiquinone oxidoreductase subunit C